MCGGGGGALCKSGWRQDWGCFFNHQRNPLATFFLRVLPISPLSPGDVLQCPGDGRLGRLQGTPNRLFLSGGKTLVAPRAAAQPARKLRDARRSARHRPLRSPPSDFALGRGKDGLQRGGGRGDPFPQAHAHGASYLAFKKNVPAPSLFPSSLQLPPGAFNPNGRGWRGDVLAACSRPCARARRENLLA